MPLHPKHTWWVVEGGRILGLAQSCAAMGSAENKLCAPTIGFTVMSKERM